jgi:para-nitrobenzyl esterase
MIEALKWINKNAQFFGGDNNRVTLFGYSSAATAIGTLGILPQSRGKKLKKLRRN